MGSCLERRRRKGACCHVGRVARTENRWTHRCVGCVVYRRAPTLVPFPSGRPFLYQPRPIPAETAKPRSSMLEKLKAPTCSTVAWLPRHRSHETAAKYRPSFPKYFRYSDSNDSRREREREEGICSAWKQEQIIAFRFLFQNDASILRGDGRGIK